MEKNLLNFHPLFILTINLYLKKDACHNNAITVKANKHTACGYSLFTHCFFMAIKINMITIEAKIV